jgi:hypothetical protein
MSVPLEIQEVMFNPGAEGSTVMMREELSGVVKGVVVMLE